MFILISEVRALRKIRSKLLLSSFLLIMGLSACGKKEKKEDGTTADTSISTETSADGSVTESTESTADTSASTENTSSNTETATADTAGTTGSAENTAPNTETTTEISTHDSLSSGASISGFGIDGVTISSGSSLGGSNSMNGASLNEAMNNNSGMTVNDEICAAYLKVLRDNESLIRAYDFQYSYVAATNPAPQDKQPRPVAFSDVTGSGVRDMLFISSEDEHSGRLAIYTFIDSEALRIYDEYIEIQAGGAASYCVFKMKNSNDLFIYRSYGDQNWTDTIMQLSFATYPFTKVREWTLERTFNEQTGEVGIIYYLDGKEVTMNEFMNNNIDTENNIDEVLLYNGALDSLDFINQILKGGCSSLSFDNAVSMLETGGATQNGNFVDPDGSSTDN